jgi:class 3 adenylate cyclase
MRPVVVTGSIQMASSPEEVWPLLTDTDRGNRLIGTNAVTFRPIEQGSKTAARFVAETRGGGFKLEYEETPFEWTYGKSFGVYRRMRSGPLNAYSLHWTLERGDAKSGNEGGTRATVRIEMEPRYSILRPIAWINAKRFVGNLVHLAAAIDAHVREKAPSPYLKPVSPTYEEQLTFAVEEMKKAGVEAALADRIGAFVRDAPDADMIRIRPFEVAERWELERRLVLRAFLRAVTAGLLELRWGIICPSCLTASQQVRALEEIALEGHCQLCDISFELDLDRAVEATFMPHPGVRQVPEQLFCIGGPARTPHVLVQANLEPGAARELDVPEKPGRYRVFARGGAVATLEIEEGGAEKADVRVDVAGVHPGRLVVCPAGKLVVTSKCEEARHVKIERLEFSNLAATAHVVSTLDEFRTLFSSDLLKRGTPLKVARVAVLFSDLTGSTALYTKVGDAAAFRLVDDHFDVLRAVVAAHDGTFVKTMGDAVMAAFTDARQCARAAVDALTHFEQFRNDAKHGELVGLKIGMYAGACYVVTANGLLDYFGQTVNVASRVQHLAGSGELMIDADTFESLGEEERSKVRIVEILEARVKGVDQPLRLARLALI